MLILYLGHSSREYKVQNKYYKYSGLARVLYGLMLK